MLSSFTSLYTRLKLAVDPQKLPHNDKLIDSSFSLFLFQGSEATTVQSSAFNQKRGSLSHGNRPNSLLTSTTAFKTSHQKAKYGQVKGHVNWPALSRDQSRRDLVAGEDEDVVAVSTLHRQWADTDLFIIFT